MPDIVRQKLEEEFPRFLNRRVTIGNASEKGQVSPGAKTRLLGLLVEARHAQTTMVQLIAPGLAALALLGLAISAIPSAPNRGAVPAPTPAKNPNVLAEQVADAFALVSIFEARVAYAPILAERLAQQRLAQEADPETITVAPASTWEMSNSIALLVLRNLPEKATLLSGAPAGPGAWAIPTNHTDELMTMLGDGFDKPVVADVEMVSRSGILLGMLRLQLLKPEAVQAMAEAEKAAKASVRKKKRRRLARHRNPTGGAANVARANDAYDPSRTGSVDQQAVATQQTPAKTDKGLFGTLFGWMGGKQNNEDSPVEDDGGPTASALGFQP